jgi:HK97 family phage portal protein
MGVADAIRNWWAGDGLLERADPDSPPAPSNVERMIARAIEARTASFTLGDALALPAVARARWLLCSQGATLSPVAYREGAPLDPQPRVVARPSSIGRPYDFTFQTIDSMLQTGDAYWRVTERDFEGQPDQLDVLDPDEVYVSWNDSRTRPVYRWRERELNANVRSGRVEIVHIPMGRRPGELEGTSPIEASLAKLAAIGAAEEFAAAYFTSGGIPEVVLKSVPRLTADEAADLLAQYNGDGGPRPVRVVSGDVGLDFPGADPQRSQLAETRSHAATEVARLLGIPGPLLLIETSGSTVLYANAQAALNELHRDTLWPMYLAPIEQAWTDLVPSTTAVRFNYRELQVADVKTRADVEEAYVRMGALAPEEVRALEGWPVGESISSSPLTRPTPPPRPVPIRSEVSA